MNTSLTKGQIQFIKELQQKEGRKLHGLYIVEGEKMVEELLSSATKFKAIYHSADYSIPLHSVQNFVQISEPDLKRISSLKTPNKVLALAIIPDNALVTSDKIVYCCKMQDPGNAGTVLRIADWFGIKDVIFSANSVDVFGPKAVQASMGAIFRVNCHFDTNSYDELRKLKAVGYLLYAADMTGQSVRNVGFNSKSVVVMGSESHGIPNDLRSMIDVFVTIPKKGQAESLNVGVACGIICEKMMFN